MSIQAEIHDRDLNSVYDIGLSQYVYRVMASTPIKQRIKLLKTHLAAENSVLLDSIASFRKLDKVGYATGLLDKNDSFAMQIPWWPLISVLGTYSAGKSTFIRAVSAAKPKVADYPFTTLVPNLGVVKVEAHRSFVVADIPGLIEGASEGAGLGIRFLKHLTRNRILLHIVDMAPFDGTEPEDAALSIAAELERFSPALAQRERWLVLNKTDLVDGETLAQRRRALLDALCWEGPVYEISAIRGQGTDRLCGDLMTYLEELRAAELADPELAEAESALQSQMQLEARERIAELRAQRSAERATGDEDEDDSDDDDLDVEVEYAP